jgi:hypothetical protein
MDRFANYHFAISASIWSSSERKGKLDMNRRDFTKFLIVAAMSIFPNHSIVAAVKDKYRLASETILPEGLRVAPEEIREAYRFAVANRDVLRYIPCYCGCNEQGHTSNASCYVKDNSPFDKPEFDPMSVG